MNAAATKPNSLWRDPDNGIVAGVCAGLGERLGVDPILLRVGFLVVAIVTAGVAVIAYLVAWAVIPASSSAGPRDQTQRTPRVRRGDWRVAAGAGLLTLSALLVFRELGIWWSDALVWPLVLAAAGGGPALGPARGRRPPRRPQTTWSRRPSDRHGPRALSARRSAAPPTSTAAASESRSSSARRCSSCPGTTRSAGSRDAALDDRGRS